MFYVDVCLRCLLHHILSHNAYTFRVYRDFVFIVVVQFMMSSNNQRRFCVKIVFVCLYIISSHYHYCANLSEGIELLKCLWDVFCRVCVCEIEHIFSVNHYTIYGAVCFQFTHLPCDDWDNIYFVLISSSNRKFRIRSWNSGVRCMSLYILWKRISVMVCKNRHILTAPEEL